MFNFLRKFKLIYQIFNFFQPKTLLKNLPLYKKYGIKKWYFSSVSSKDFKGVIHQENQKNDIFIPKNILETLSEKNQKSLTDYAENGFAILENYLSEKQVNAINQEIDNLLEQKKIAFRYRNKIMFAIEKSPLLLNLGKNEHLLSILNCLLQGKAKLFQSINFLNGSEQATHSDFIHMTTFPTGGLLGVWIALEDITEENGPLHYYPKSHTLPYFMLSDFDKQPNSLTIREDLYQDYEKFIANKVNELGLKKQIFYAKKGDVLIWHANLLHGGEPHLNKSKTRKSMVFHYFKENVICYHEITQRPALLKEY